MAITKADIVKHLIENCKIERLTAVNFVESFFEQIKVTLESGDVVKLSGFGTFNTHRKNARPGRNPRTGEEVEVTERTVVTFKPGPSFKNIVDKEYSKNNQ